MSNLKSFVLLSVLICASCWMARGQSNYVSHPTIFSGAGSLGPVSPLDLSSGDSLGGCSVTNVLASGYAPVQCSADGGATWSAAPLITPEPLYHTIAGSQWIGCPGQGAFSDAIFQTVVELPANVTSASISIQVFADNAATVYVNGVAIGAQPQEEIPSNFQSPPAQYSGSLSAGANVLEIVNHNFNDPSGLDFVATVTYQMADPVMEWEIKDGTGAAVPQSAPDGRMRLPPDGLSTATVTIINTNVAEMPTFTLTRTEGAVDTWLELTASGAVVHAGTNYGSVMISAAVTSSGCFATNFYFDLTDCQSCAGGECEVQPGSGSVDIRMSLGPTRLLGAGQAFLQIKSELPDPALGTPQLLQSAFMRPEVQNITNANGWLRQVAAMDRILDVVTNSEVSYSVKFYDWTNNTGQVNGLYQFSGSPFRSVTIELLAGDTNQLRVTDSAGPHISDYVWLGDGWALIKGGGLSTEIKTSTQAGAVRTQVHTLENALGVVESTEVESWESFAFGDRLIQEVFGSGANARTNSYTYNTNGLVETASRYDGSWDIYQYDAMGRQTAHYRPFGNAAPTTNASLCRLTASSYTNSVVSGSGDDGTVGPFTPRQVIEYVQGIEVSRRYTVLKVGQRIDIQCVNPGAAWNDASNLFTTNLLRTDLLHFGQPSAITRPDGTMQLFAYDQLPPPGTTWPVALRHVAVWTGAQTGYTNVVDGVRQDTWMDEAGRTRLERQTDVASSAVTSETSYFYDHGGHLTNTVYLGGLGSSQNYDCCHLVSSTELDGTVVSYTYDALQRQLTTTRAGITTSNVYNSVGNVLAVVRYGTDGSSMPLSQSVYDDGGQQVSSSDALGHATIYTNYLDASGQLVRRTTYPDLSTRIETYARDGSLLQVGGTAVHGMRYEYGVQSDAGIQRPYTKEIKLDGLGNDTAEWNKTLTDGAGRAYKTIFADSTPATETDNPYRQSFFNGQGQRNMERDPDEVTALYAYNSRGELEYTAVDLDGDGQLHADGTNRITRTVSDVVTNAALGAVVRRTQTYVWPFDNTDLPRLASSQEVSADGLQTCSVTWNDGVGVTNRSVTAYAGNGLRYVTNWAPNGSYTISSYQSGRPTSVVAKDARGAQLLASTYGYDAHGRQTSMTDARNGVTTLYYNDADQNTAVLTPSPDGVQAGQLTTNLLDDLGRVWRSILPDNTCVTNEYFSTGELKKTYGSRNYPVEYTYDSQGRMETMTTWTNFASGTGAAVTTWNYDIYRGWLTNKSYADGKGPDYTYTAAGRLRTRTWARGVVTTYDYNNAGDLAAVFYSDGVTPGVTNTYNRLGQLASVARDSSVWSYAYNAAGQRLSENTSGGPLDGLSVVNGYDSLLRRASLTLNSPQGILSSTVYGYNQASRLQSVLNGQTVVIYGYVPNSPLVGSVTFWQNGEVRLDTRKQYDFLNRLTAISSTPTGAGQSPVAFNYQYNDANQRVAVTNADASHWVYQYDNLGQVISGKKYWSDGTPVAGQQFEYGFDDIGNRTSTEAGGDADGANLRPASYNVNNLNQYITRTVPGAVDILGAATNTASVTVNSQAAYRKGEYFRSELALDNSQAAVWAGVTNVAVLDTVSTTNMGSVFLPQTPEAFFYDPDGNLTNDGRWTYTWDAENRLIEMGVNTAVGPQKYLRFEYDWQGRRIGKQVWNNATGTGDPAETIKLLYDGWNLVAEVNATNGLVRSYLWGLDLSRTEQGAGGVGGLVAVNDVAGETGMHFIACDGNGNVTALVKASNGTVSANYEYGPFGEVIRATGPLAKANPFRFSTKYQDDETDLIYFGMRWYSATVGRWLSRDPLEERGGRNLYYFLGNNAVSRLDPRGEIPFDEVLDALVLAVDLATGAGYATIALDVAALAIPYIPPNPRIGVVFRRLAKEHQWVDKAELRAVEFMEWSDLGARPQKAKIVLEYRGRLRNQTANEPYPKHFSAFRKSEAVAKQTSINGPATFSPEIDDSHVRIFIDEALRKFKSEHAVARFQDLDGYVYDARLPFGTKDSFRTWIGWANGKCTTKIKIHVGKDGDVHAFPIL